MAIRAKAVSLIVVKVIPGLMIVLDSQWIYIHLCITYKSVMLVCACTPSCITEQNINDDNYTSKKIIYGSRLWIVVILWQAKSTPYFVCCMIGYKH